MEEMHRIILKENLLGSQDIIVDEEFLQDFERVGLFSAHWVETVKVSYLLCM